MLLRTYCHHFSHHHHPLDHDDDDNDDDDDDDDDDNDDDGSCIPHWPVRVLASATAIFGVSREGFSS